MWRLLRFRWIEMAIPYPLNWRSQQALSTIKNHYNTFIPSTTYFYSICTQSHIARERDSNVIQYAFTKPPVLLAIALLASCWLLWLHCKCMHFKEFVIPIVGNVHSMELARRHCKANCMHAIRDELNVAIGNDTTRCGVVVCGVAACRWRWWLQLYCILFGSVSMHNTSIVAISQG